MYRPRAAWKAALRAAWTPWFCPRAMTRMRGSEDAAAWAMQRETFGKPLSKHQVVRHKLAEMLRHVHASTALLDNCAWRVRNGETPVAELSLLKVQATRTMEFCAREAM